MEVIRFKKIKYKGKVEYLYDPKGNFILVDNEFISTRVSKKPINGVAKKEFESFIKGKPYLKNRVKSIKDFEKKLFYVKVWYLTELNDLTTLKNHERRKFRGMNLDHIFPISIAFKRNIPPEIVAHIDNLRFIPYKQNMKKGNTVTEEAELIIKKLMKALSN